MQHILRTGERVMRRYWQQVLAALMVAMALQGAALPSRAQTDAQSAGFLTPFPENDTYQIVLLGDSLAEPLIDTLPEALSSDGKQVLRKPQQQLSGLITQDNDAELKKIDEALKAGGVHIAIVLVGADERQPLRFANGRRAAVGSQSWRDEYGRRVDTLMKLLRRYKLATYWVGQPVMRRGDWNDDVQVMNEIVREKALLNQVRYVDIFQAFADDSGNFDARGPDITGKERVLREGDGVHFTMAGARKLAHFIEREVRRDIAQAKQERVVPLAGDEAEQRKLAAARAQSGDGGTGMRGGAASGAPGAAGRAGAATPQALAGLDQKAESSRVSLKVVGAGNREETIAIDILRPAIPAAVVELVTRRESADRPALIGEVVVDDIGAGVTVLSSVTLAPESLSTGRRTDRQTSSNSAYYRVMVKGERLPVKPGRTDDLRWPPVHEQVEAPTRPASALPASSAKAKPRT